MGSPTTVLPRPSPSSASSFSTDSHASWLRLVAEDDVASALDLVRRRGVLDSRRRGQPVALAPEGDVRRCAEDARAEHLLADGDAEPAEEVARRGCREGEAE